MYINLFPDCSEDIWLGPDTSTIRIQRDNWISQLELESHTFGYTQNADSETGLKMTHDNNG